MESAARTSSGFDIRRGADRGATSVGWLESRHSFSFGGYHDPARMGFRSLRVINDDWIEPGTGFGEHPHRDMEILTWVLSGGLRHADSTGGGGVLRPGELQAMSAGSGIRHSEMNASGTERAHFLQVWIEPRREGMEARYEQRAFDAAGRRDAWQVLANSDGSGGALGIDQDASLSVADVGAGASLAVSVGAGRYGYLHVAAGEVEVDGVMLGEGNALEIAGPAELSIRGVADGQVLLFDLA